ncbi:MAG: hypothetical protein PWQ22_98 [Archaeoglobaceae archaeon]|nr:hypothetical protein [Archaeoglobaceae archaeon]MDK2875688.1 hypothetical protein [Archaeoglobaceae archaeon]
MKHKFYILQIGDEVTSEGIEETELFKKLRDSGIKKAILVGEETAIYFEAFEKKFVMVGVERKSAGVARIIARNLVSRSRKKIDFSSLEEVFEFAKRVENADLDELAKLR